MINNNTKDRMLQIRSVKEIKINQKTLHLIESSYIYSKKGMPTGEYQIFACKYHSSDEPNTLSSKSVTRKPSKIKEKTIGSINTDGIPSYVNGTNLLDNDKIGSKAFPLTIALDSEWTTENNKRVILSYQFFTVITEKGYDVLYALIIYPYYGGTYSLPRCFKIFLDCIWKNHSVVFNPKRYIVEKDLKNDKKNEVLFLQIVSHFGCVDIASFYSGISKLFPKLFNVNNTVISSRDIPIFLNDQNNNAKKAYLSFRDTILLTDDKKSLSEIGEMINIPKIDNPYIENMGSLLCLYPQTYIEYAITDCYIVLEYTKVFNNGVYHLKLPTTLSSEACKLIKDKIMNFNNWTVDEFNLNFRGLKKVKRNSNLSESMYKTSLEPLMSAIDIIDSATWAYFGGYNTALCYGIFCEKYWDYDLAGAYPVAMSMSPDIDFTRNPQIIIDIDITPIISTKKPNDYGFGLVEFEFPSTCIHPCIPINDTEGRGLIYPLKGQSYACHPEIYLAVKLGARIYAHKWVIPYTIENQYSLREAYRDLIIKRNSLANFYGENSPQELKQKLINNMGYGNVARGLSGKRSYSIASGNSETLPPSDITCAPYASHSTSLIRATILALINDITLRGYNVLHATTDGFMSNIPFNKLSSLDSFGFGTAYKSVLKDLIGNDEILKIKHKADINVVLKTRCNVGYSADYEGNLARAGYKYNKDERSLKSNEQNLLIIDKFLSRNGPIISTYSRLPSMREIMAKGKDYVGVEHTSNLDMNWDWKRKLINPREINATINGKMYSHLTAESAPFISMEEYNLYKSVSKNITLLISMDDYDKYLICLSNRENNTRNTGSVEKNIARSILRYIRKKELTGFENLNGVQITETISEYLNVKLTPNDWKKSGLSERNQNTLSRDVLDNYINDLGLRWID